MLRIPWKTACLTRGDMRRQTGAFVWHGLILPAVVFLLSTCGSAKLSTAQRFFFGGAAVAEKDDAEKNADWSIDEMLEKAEEALDQQWDGRFKLYRARALVRFDEIERMCQLTEPQRRKLVAACKGMAYKQTWQWRRKVQNAIAQDLEGLQRQGMSQAEAKELVANYTSGYVYFGSSGDEGCNPEEFWKRTVESVLNPEQRRMLSRRQKLREERQRRIQIDRTLVALDRGLRLTDEQESRLRKLIVTHELLNTQGIVLVDPFDEYWHPSWVFSALFQRPEVLKILSKAQWEVVKQSMERRWGGQIVVEEEEEQADEEEAAETAEPDEGDDGKDENAQESDGQDDTGDHVP